MRQLVQYDDSLNYILPVLRLKAGQTYRLSIANRELQYSQGGRVNLPPLNQKRKTMKHYITISSGKRIPMGIYVRGVKLAIANPDMKFSEGLTSWWSTTGKEIREQFLESIHDRINQKCTEN